MQTNRKMIIGLVGGIGSGKSAIAQCFAQKGGKLILGDALGHEALEQPDILARIKERWKDRVLNPEGQVDRNKMGAIVFASPVERVNLEYLVHPWITKRILEEIEKGQNDPKVVFLVLDAAIMLEKGWNHVCDRIVYIHTHRETRLKRLAQHRGWTADDLVRRETAQLPLTRKVTRADVAIDNSQTLEATEQQVEHWLQTWKLIGSV